MKKSCSYAIADLLPHAPPAILLDRVLEWDEGMVEAVVNIKPGIPFYIDGYGVPAHVGLEYMAQSCGAWADCTPKRRNNRYALDFCLVRVILRQRRLGLRREQC